MENLAGKTDAVPILYRPPTNKKSPDNRLRTFAAVHCQGQANLNLFQILRQIPRTSQHTVDFHALAFIVDAIEHQTGHLLSGILHHKMTTGARLNDSCWGVRSPKPCWKRVRQTGSYSAIFFHFLILVLNVPNGATVLTCINLYTSQTAVLVDSSAHFLICGSNNSSSLNESIIS